MSEGTLALFGDSIANGLGVRDQRYGQLVADALALHLCDFSGSAMRVTESLQRLRDSDISPDVAIVAHGVTEAVVRPTPRALRYMPSRWRQPGWMDPRPYFSRRIHRRLVERAESALRWRVKRALMSIAGVYQFVPAAEYESEITVLVAELQRRGSLVILVGAPELDTRYFPGSLAEVARYRDISRATASAAGAQFVELVGELTRWDDFFADHFHPNEHGHARIAAEVVAAAERARTTPR